jgi:hypothetical protein
MDRRGDGYDEKVGDYSIQQGNDVYSKAVRAGKRTYFFDVKATRRNEYYLTITESMKKTDHHGDAYFQKHKIFLYKEDFEKFSDCLHEIVDYIENNQPLTVELEGNEASVAEFSNIEFDDF